MSTPPTAWLVRRKVERDPDDGSGSGSGDILDPGEQYWAVYETEAEAVRCARDLDRAEMVVNGCRAKVFAWGFEAATTLPEFALRDWMLDENIPVPDGSTITDWRLWWVRMRDTNRPITRAQFRHMLEALNKLPLYTYEVVPAPKAESEPLQAVGYAVIHRDWVYNDVGFNGGNEPVAVHRTRASAEAEAARRMAADPRFRGPLCYGDTRHWQDGAADYVVVELPLHPED